MLQRWLQMPLKTRRERIRRIFQDYMGENNTPCSASHSKLQSTEYSRPPFLILDQFHLITEIMNQLHTVFNYSWCLWNLAGCVFYPQGKIEARNHFKIVLFNYLWTSWEIKEKSEQMTGKITLFQNILFERSFKIRTQSGFMSGRQVVFKYLPIFLNFHNYAEDSIIFDNSYDIHTNEENLLKSSIEIWKFVFEQN